MKILMHWIRRLVAFVILLFAIILPIGLLNPFTAGDYVASGETPPGVLDTLVWLIPLEALILFAVYLIDPKKTNKKPG